MINQANNSYDDQDERVPSQCREGPIVERSCTDFCCCVIYLVLIASVILLSILCAQHQKLTQVDIEDKLTKNEFGHPLLAISRAMMDILLALAVVAAVCLILLITTFIFPSLVTYFYMPLMLILMLLLGAAFLYRYFGHSFPFISEQQQNHYLKKDSLMALGVGIGFLAAFVLALITICCKRQKFGHILPVLQMAKTCFWQNCYMFFVSIALAVLSILFLYINIILLELSQNVQHPKLAHFLLTGLVIVEALWTHGFMESLSDFLFQAISIHWYFNGKKYGEGYSKCGRNLSASLGLCVRHIGTIAFASILAYIPDFLNLWLTSCERCSPSLYGCCCCLHKCTCRKFSKYSHCMTILQNLAFCPATDEMYSLRKRAKSILPQIYLMGNFFMTLAKILLTMIGLVVCYILMLQSHPNLFDKIPNLVPPLVVTFIAGLEVATHFMNISGLVGDTLAFMYVVDFEIEKSYFGQMEINSCPQDIKDIIQNVKIADSIAYD